MGLRSRSSGLSALAGWLLAASALAQGAVANSVPAEEPTLPGDAPEWGTLAPTAYTVSALEFQTFGQSNTWAPVGGSPNRYLTNAAGYFEVPLHLPNGARIESFQIEGCDDTATGQITGLLAKATSPASTGTGIDSVASGNAATPGCAQFTKVLAAPITVNANDRFFIEMSGDGTDNTVFAAARVFYRLQVSPAPLTATFGDVPTGHPFHRFIEALAAAGITGGCGSGNYCPDNAVTRGQMAVFLSVALGLHFPN